MLRSLRPYVSIRRGATFGEKSPVVGDATSEQAPVSGTGKTDRCLRAATARRSRRDAC